MDKKAEDRLQALREEVKKLTPFELEFRTRKTSRAFETVCQAGDKDLTLGLARMMLVYKEEDARRMRELVARLEKEA